MSVHILIINAFTKDGKGGNPAGVILNADSLSSEQMQMIATQVDHSETIFITSSKRADYRLRFFSRNTELDMCGHATIAAYSALFQKNQITPGEYLQEIQAGLLKISVFEEGRIVMDQRQPEFKKEIKSEALANVLKIPSEWIVSTKLVPQVVSTGLNDLMLPIDTREHLFAILPDDARISQFEEENELDSFHVFTSDVLDNSATTHSRSFDPLHGIHEEAATGSAHGALACYLFQNKVVQEEDAVSGLVFEQGYILESPSEIFVKLDISANTISRVRVGGFGHIVDQKQIVV